MQGVTRSCPTPRRCPCGTSIPPWSCCCRAGVLARGPVPRPWRFASVSDLLNIFKASFIGMVAIILVLMWKRFDGVPMSVLVIYPFALSALLGAPPAVPRLEGLPGTAVRFQRPPRADPRRRRRPRPWCATCAAPATSSRSACSTTRRTCVAPSCRACRSWVRWMTRRRWSARPLPSCWSLPCRRWTPQACSASSRSAKAPACRSVPCPSSVTSCRASRCRAS